MEDLLSVTVTSLLKFVFNLCGALEFGIGVRTSSLDVFITYHHAYNPERYRQITLSLLPTET